MSKIHANSGIKRNKKPLQNIVYRVVILNELKDCNLDSPLNKSEEFLLKDTGYLVLYSQYEKQLDIKPNTWNFHGFITPDKLKEILGLKQWSKFRQGQRIFTIQRRNDGKNL